MKTFITNSVNETKLLAHSLAEKLKEDTIIFFEGGLGMGKTAFIQGLCEALGVNEDVTSPTFAIVNEHITTKSIIYHFDMYRIENEEQLYNIGFYDYLDAGGILAIEWSENIKKFFNDYDVKISFVKINENTRNITIEGVDL